jgi:hypothetical protein
MTIHIWLSYSEAMTHEKSRFLSYPDQSSLYEIRIRGQLDGRWSTWFSDLTITRTHTSDQPPITILIGPVADQAALRGILCKLWDLNLTLISVRRIEVDDKKGHGND